jgi:hypothetical protein
MGGRGGSEKEENTTKAHHEHDVFVWRQPSSNKRMRTRILECGSIYISDQPLGAVSFIRDRRRCANSRTVGFCDF